MSQPSSKRNSATDASLLRRPAPRLPYDPGTIKQLPMPPRPKVPENKLHLYSPAIAKQLNKQQPDITASVILHNLSLWQRNKYKQTLIGGRRYSFRSLAELQNDHPYFTRSAIHKAIQRLEERLGEEFMVRRDKNELWFSLGDQTMDRLKQSSGGRKKRAPESTPLHSFYKWQAVKMNGVKPAVLYANLNHALSHFKNPKRDADGYAYAEMSPSKLSPILGFSEDTIARTLKAMCEGGYIAKHPDASSFYRFTDFDFTPAKPRSKPSAEVDNATAKVHTQTAEIHSKTAEVDARPANVHSGSAEVHSTCLPIPLEPLQNQGLQRDGQVTYITECITQCGTECVTSCIKEDIKVSNHLASASPSELGSNPSLGLHFIEELAKSSLHKLRSSLGKDVKVPAARSRNKVCRFTDISPYDIALEGSTAIDDLPYTVVLPDATPVDDLPYDMVVPQAMLQKTWTKQQVEDVLFCWDATDMNYDEQDEQNLRKFFNDNPRLSADDFIEVMRTYAWLEIVTQNPLHPEPGRFDRFRFLRNAKTPKQILRYFPQLLAEIFLEPPKYTADDGSFIWEGDLPAPFDTLDFAYLAPGHTSSMIKVYRSDLIEVEYVESSASGWTAEKFYAGRIL